LPSELEFGDCMMLGLISKMREVDKGTLSLDETGEMPQPISVGMRSIKHPPMNKGPVPDRAGRMAADNPDGQHG
jgi:hypothetical protein